MRHRCAACATAAQAGAHTGVPPRHRSAGFSAGGAGRTVVDEQARVGLQGRGPGGQARRSRTFSRGMRALGASPEPQPAKSGCPTENLCLEHSSGRQVRHVPAEFPPCTGLAAELPQHPPGDRTKPSGALPLHTPGQQSAGPAGREAGAGFPWAWRAWKTAETRRPGHKRHVAPLPAAPVPTQRKPAGCPRRGLAGRAPRGWRGRT